MCLTFRSSEWRRATPICGFGRWGSAAIAHLGVSLRDAYGSFSAIKNVFAELDPLDSARIAGSHFHAPILADVVATGIC